MSSVLSPAPRATDPTRAARGLELLERRALAFTAAIMATSLLLQRFALPAGGKNLSIVGPIGLALGAVGLLRGVLAFDRGRLAAFLALTGWAALGVAWSTLEPGSFGTSPNLRSLAQFLLVSGFATLTFARPVDERRFFATVNKWFAVIAVAGLLQFALQLVGVRVFAFSPFLPHQIMFEAGYNLTIPIGVASLYKSNGFFLVEPSVFSQVMAVALIVEVLAFRRARFLALFVAALLVSFSGTGWIVLASFIAAATLSLGRRGLVVAAATAALLGLAVGAAALLAPSFVGAVSGRFHEISQIGTSGHMRFVTPFWLAHDVLQRDPAAALLGMGAGASEQVMMPYEYDVNTPVKVALEYGFPALLAYLLLLVLGRKTAVQRALVVPGVVLLLFAGGYQQFPAMLFPILLIISVARLAPAEGGAG
jgi:hypothetical protein